MLFTVEAKPISYYGIHRKKAKIKFLVKEDEKTFTPDKIMNKVYDQIRILGKIPKMFDYFVKPLKIQKK